MSFLSYNCGTAYHSVNSIPNDIVFSSYYQILTTPYMLPLSLNSTVTSTGDNSWTNDIVYYAECCDQYRPTIFIGFYVHETYVRLKDEDAVDTCAGFYIEMSDLRNL